jgi:hypothetical protein
MAIGTRDIAPLDNEATRDIKRSRVTGCREIG